MTMKRLFQLVCDQCGNQPDQYCGAYSSDVREHAKQDGWRIGNKDLCPACLTDDLLKRNSAILKDLLAKVIQP